MSNNIELEECLICSAVLGNARADRSVEDVAVTTCNHRFGSQCLQTLLVDHGSCPLCRTVLVVHDEAEVEDEEEEEVIYDLPNVENFFTQLRAQYLPVADVVVAVKDFITDTIAQHLATLRLMIPQLAYSRHQPLRDYCNFVLNTLVDANDVF
jgi:uncharacterized protein YbaR (Trm112 family)